MGEILLTRTVERHGLTFRVEHLLDTRPDISGLGTYTSTFAPYCVDRKTGTLYGEYRDYPEHTCYPCGGNDVEPNCEACSAEAGEYGNYEVLAEGLPRWNSDREYRYCQVGENYQPSLGTTTGDERAEYIRYCCEDYKRLRALESGEWYSLGVRAVLVIDSMDLDSESLWGIESDSGEEHFGDVAGELIDTILSRAKYAADALEGHACLLREAGREWESERDVGRAETR